MRENEQVRAPGVMDAERAAASGIAGDEHAAASPDGERRPVPEGNVPVRAAPAVGTGPTLRIVHEPLPEYLRERPTAAWQWPMPTAWLLGTKLIGSLRDIVLSSVAKVDLRSWMTAGQVIDLTGADATKAKDAAKATDAIPATAVESTAVESTAVESTAVESTAVESTAAAPATGPEAYYLDFLADSGDSQRMVYQLARLLKQSELVVKRWEHGEEQPTPLPRGSLLVLGGDTAYPIATHRRLLERIRAPFQWAHDELKPEEKQTLQDNPVTLLAVPGNHDYYDGLRGFEALTHSPPVVITSGRGAQLSSEPLPPSEQPLRLPGYRLAQHASYFAAALPFGWQLWGLDVEMREIDDRQLAFFQGASRWKKDAPPPSVTTAKDPAPSPPEKLILVTSRPGFVYQGRSDHAQILEPSLERLGLTPSFARNGALEGERVRLDLSGDVHTYERYWGAEHGELPDSVDQLCTARLAGKRLRSDTRAYEAPERYRPAGADATVRKRGNDKAPPSEASTRPNYASVVSGLGGAFHHPSQVRRGKTPPCAAWPSAEHSAREIGVRLVDPYEVFRAGAVGIVGLLIAAACYLLGWSGANVLGLPLATAKMRPAFWAALGDLGQVATLVGIVLAMIALPIAGYYLGRVIARPIREMRPLDDLWPARKTEQPGHSTPPEEPREGSRAWWRRAIRKLSAPLMRAGRAAADPLRRATCASMAWWLRWTRRATHWAPIARLLGVLGANPRSTWLFAATIVAWVGTPVGWWLLGRSFGTVAGQVEASGLVVIDVVITILVVGMAALGLFRAGQKIPIEDWPTNIVRRMFLGVFGAAIAVLAIWTPYAWIRLVCCHWPVSLIGLVVAVLTILVRFGHWVFRRGLRARQFMTWLGFLLLVAGAVTLPMCCARIEDLAPPSPLHWLLMLPLVPIVGAYFACLWVGWYFCICLQWNRHGNEAGSAARVTDFGAFLRIKLTADKAEVWAISVEEPLAKPSRWCHLLKRKVRQFEPMPTARLIDHFTVERATAADASASSSPETR